MLDALKPFAWLAVFAFLTGFVSYLALGQPAVAHANAPYAAPAAGEASWPASEDWEFAKRI